MNSILIFALISATLPCLALAQGAFGHSKVGIEQEYLAKNTSRDLNDISNHQELLGFVRAEFGGSKIKISGWEKYANALGTLQATFTDAKQRKWAVVPEKMTFEQFDGYEQITPPLETEDDVEKYGRAIDAIHKSGKFLRGGSSSTHFTFDVSDLIGDSKTDRDHERKNISEFVDLVLFLETNVVSIFQQVRPNRYGHIVNDFAVPLAVNQKALLHQLAETPREERTFAHVRAIFQRHGSREISLVHGLEQHAWKFRTFNYGKIFGLGPFRGWQLPVVEFRMSDLIEDSATLKRVGTLFARTLAVGSKTPVTHFHDPLPEFEGFYNNTSEHARLDDFIRNSSMRTADGFVRRIQAEGGFPLQGRCEQIFVSTARGH